MSRTFRIAATDPNIMSRRDADHRLPAAKPQANLAYPRKISRGQSCDQDWRAYPCTVATCFRIAVRRPHIPQAERTQRSIDFRDGPAAQQAIDKVLTSLSPKDKAKVKDIVNHY